MYQGWQLCCEAFFQLAHNLKLMAWTFLGHLLFPHPASASKLFQLRAPALLRGVLHDSSTLEETDERTGSAKMTGAFATRSGYREEKKNADLDKWDLGTNEWQIWEQTRFVNMTLLVWLPLFWFPPCGLGVRWFRKALFMRYFVQTAYSLHFFFSCLVDVCFHVLPLDRSAV